MAQQASFSGLPPVSGGAKVKESVDPIEEIVGALTDPMIAYPSPWIDTIPEQMKKDLPIHRLMHLMLCTKGKADWEEACDLETLIYLYPAALEFPLDGDWAQIYFYLGTKYMGDKVPPELRVENLSDYEERLLRDLKRWIYQKKVKLRKERMRQKEAAEPQGEVIAEKNEQLKLF